MNNPAINPRLDKLCKLAQSVDPKLSFTLFEIGAVPVNGQPEPFHALLNYFPDSKIIAFEVDKDLCDKLNQQVSDSIRFYPVALGQHNEECDFYETNHPMCCSLYKPNEHLLNYYHNLDVAKLKTKGRITTTRLDDFTHENNIRDADFIKIDIQGAELDVFKAGSNTLADVVCIVSEVEFIPLYENQPLFGDVCEYLIEQDFMFHKFLNLSGRTIKPVLMKNNENFASQHMWSDAVFIHDITKLDKLAPEKLLKLSILAFIYNSPDVCYHCLATYDTKSDTSIAQRFLQL